MREFVRLWHVAAERSTGKKIAKPRVMKVKSREFHAMENATRTGEEEKLVVEPYWIMHFDGTSQFRNKERSVLKL
ncbi:MAG TPA: hypothetical protein PLY93_12535 [Turneriella sp.]|nr:hypothetical protein [Turneriella sp.]